VEELVMHWHTNGELHSIDDRKMFALQGHLQTS
jgi:hypothetical protein